MEAKVKLKEINKGGLVNKGKNALTKQLRKKKYVDEDITNFELLESGLDETLVKKSRRFYKIGINRGADMILNAIRDGKIEVGKDKKGVFFKYSQKRIKSKRKLKIKAGNKTVQESYTAVLKMEDYFEDR